MSAETFLRCEAVKVGLAGNLCHQTVSLHTLHKRRDYKMMSEELAHHSVTIIL